MKPSNKPYETDASQIIGNAAEVVFPKTIQEICEVVKKYENITARGAGTGLAGGAVPNNGVVLDLSKMNKILNFYKSRKSVEVEAGVILGELNDLLERQNLEFPVKPSSYEVCTIGGMIATDAVGSRAIKYGRTSKWVEWIEVVDSNGEVKRVGRTELNDYSGKEGTTGIIVKAMLNLIEKPERTATLLSGDSIDEIISLVIELKRNQDVSMIEFFDKMISGFLGLEKKHHLLIEFESDTGKMKKVEYEDAMKMRDSIYPVLAQKGYFRIEDPKIFVEKFRDLFPWFEQNRVPVYGHLSVGILHPCFNSEQEKLIPELMKIVKKFKGQISGEHGIGILKKQFLDDADKKLYMIVKNRTDPKNKFNPGKVVDVK